MNRPAAGCAAFVLILFGVVSTARADDKGPPPALESRLKVNLPQGISAKGGKLSLELTFSNPSGKEQKFANTEYRIAILNADGEQIPDVLVFNAVLREVVLKDRSTTDKPGVAVAENKLKAGDDYYLVVSVRNLVGLAKFKAVE